MKLPYILLADDNPDHRKSFVTVFEEQVAYAAVSIVDSGQSLLSFLSGCGWKDLPNLIVLNYQLADMTAANVMRELLLDSRYLTIPKLVLLPAWNDKHQAECRMLGVKHFLLRAENLFDFEHNVHKIDDLLKAELSI